MGLAPSGSTSSSSSSGSGGGGPVLIQGGAEKGPVILGSSVSVSLLDGAGVPTGAQFDATVTNDAGAFELTLPMPSRATLEASGYYFNEVLGALSESGLTLRAHADLDGTAPVYVNLLTHLTFARTTTLLAQNMPLAAAQAQAESELLVAMGIGPTGFDPLASASDVTLLQGDAGDRMFFFNEDDNTPEIWNPEVWTTDATATGTRVMVPGVEVFPRFFSGSGYVFFAGNDQPDEAWDPWRCKTN